MMHRITTKRQKLGGLIPFPCRACLQNCSDGQNSICCDLCNCWLHDDCINLTEELKSVYNKEPELSFYCATCALDERKRYAVAD
jgi:hypothetical protein